jgi:hypothetical protein
MVVLRFRSDEVKRSCCNLASMHKLWGPVAAGRISHRLQQLEAMETLSDLNFLPLDWAEHDNGQFEIEISDHLSLFVERGPETSQGEAPMYTVTVVGLHARSMVASTP